MAQASNDGDELSRLRQELLAFVLDQAATDQDTIDRVAQAIEGALSERVTSLVDRRLAPHEPDQIAEKVAAILQSRLPALPSAVAPHFAGLPPEPPAYDDGEPSEESSKADSEQRGFLTRYRWAILAVAMVLLLALAVAVTWVVAESYAIDAACPPAPAAAHS